jgi:hypothetical protein
MGHVFGIGSEPRINAGLRIAIWTMLPSWPAVVFLASVLGEQRPTVINDRQLGIQEFKLIAPDVAFKVTAFDRRLDAFDLHARRLLKHVELRALAWININLKQVRFTMLERRDGSIRDRRVCFLRFDRANGQSQANTTDSRSGVRRWA